MRTLIRRLLGLPPRGYDLVMADGRRRNRIRGDLVPRDSLVIVDGADGRVFVRTGEVDSGFAVYREDHRTHLYAAWD